MKKKCKIEYKKGKDNRWRYYVRVHESTVPLIKLGAAKVLHPNDLIAVSPVAGFKSKERCQLVARSVITDGWEIDSEEAKM